MSNDFYNHGSFPTTGSAATSASMRAELDSIAAGFDKMPTLTGNANEIIVVNPSATGLASIPSLPATAGGTGQTSYAVGDLLYASTTTALSKLADVATGNALISGGVGVAPSYGKIGLTTHVTGTLPVANGGTGITSFGTGVATALGINVGTAGAFVVNGGALGTPSSGTLTNATGLPVGTGISGLGTNVATALAVNVGTAGAFVVYDGALGTPSSGTLTNATGLPVGTGISGLGTNVATALAVNVGTAGAFVVNGGALGTPSSGTVTNLTGTASININGTVGATTPSTGAFTTLTTSGNVTLGDASTDTVQVNGVLGVGVTPAAKIGVYIAGNTDSVSVDPYGVRVARTITSNATSTFQGYSTQGLSTAASAFTIVNIVGFSATDITKGAGSTITNQYGIRIEDQTQGTNNYGISSAVSSGANKWNIYASGTAANYFAGETQLANNLAFQGTGNRITGDFSNATVANRVTFQTSTANSSTVIAAMPSGTGIASAFRAYSSNDPDNTSIAGMTAVSSLDARFASDRTGTGTYLPMTFYTGGSEAMRIETSNRVIVQKSSNGALTALTSSAASIAVNLDLANNFTHTTTESTTLANPTNMTAGQYGVIVITQGATPRTMAFGSNWKFAAGTVPSLTATASAVDVLAYYVESATRITARLIADVK